MKTVRALIASTIVTTASLAAAMFLLDSLAPALRTQAEVWDGSLGPGNVDRVYYMEPLTAGELAFCEVGAAPLRGFRPGMPITVRRSWLLDRCVGIERAGRWVPAR